MSGASEGLIAELGHAPRVLILGQRFLAPTEAEDPVLTAAAGAPVAAFSAWWFDQAAPLEQKCERLTAAGRTLELPAPLEALSRLPWTHALTSAVNPTPRRLLEVPGRRPVFEQFQPADRLDASAMALFRLFGSVARHEVAEQPPPTPAALRLWRQQQAGKILDSLAAWTTPTGRVWVEGWDPRRDWLRPADLARALVQLGQGQVRIFGVDDAALELLRADDDFAYLLEAGVVVTDPGRLANHVAALAGRPELEALADRRLVGTTLVTLQVREHSPAKLGLISPAPATSESSSSAARTGRG